jgi:hypothetical protein
MTKKPTEEEFWEKMKFCKNDTAAMAEDYECSRQTIYNWWNEFEANKSNREAEELARIEDETVSNAKSEDDKPFSHFIEKQKESTNQPDMREVSIGVPNSCLVIMLADTHFGSKYSDVEMAEEIKNLCINTKNVYCFFGGDLVDFQGAGPPDLAYDQVFANPNATRAMAEAYIREFAGKMLLLLTGCHSNWTYRFTGETFEERLVKYLPTKAVFKDSVIINFKVGDVVYRGHIAHKAGKGHSRYNPSHGGFQEAREDLDVDFVVSAHRHTAGVAIQYVRMKEVVVVNCGTCKCLDTFANKTFTQKPLSMSAVYFDGKNKRLIPFFHYKDGIEYVKKLNESNSRREVCECVKPCVGSDSSNT